jgi:hypothetical protein
MSMILITIGNGGDFVTLAILGTIAISLLEKGLFDWWMLGPFYKTMMVFK